MAFEISSAASNRLANITVNASAPGTKGDVGQQGIQGKQGVGIATISLSSGNGDLLFTLTDGTQYAIPLLAILGVSQDQFKENMHQYLLSIAESDNGVEGDIYSNGGVLTLCNTTPNETTEGTADGNEK